MKNLSNGTKIQVEAYQKARISTTLKTNSGPLMLRNIEYLVFNHDMDEVLLSRPVLQSLGFNLEEHLSKVRQNFHETDFSDIGFSPNPLRSFNSKQNHTSKQAKDSLNGIHAESSSNYSEKNLQKTNSRKKIWNSSETKAFPKNNRLITGDWFNILFIFLLIVIQLIYYGLWNANMEDSQIHFVLRSYPSNFSINTIYHVHKNIQPPPNWKIFHHEKYYNYISYSNCSRLEGYSLSNTSFIPLEIKKFQVHSKSSTCHFGEGNVARYGYLWHKYMPIFICNLFVIYFMSNFIVLFRYLIFVLYSYGFNFIIYTNSDTLSNRYI